MRIAICDDEAVITQELSRMTRDYFSNAGLDVDIDVFSDAETLLSVDVKFDLLLLDCKLPGADGVELARRIKTRSGRSEIIFITAFSDYLFESYDVNHLKYILKPVSVEQLTKTFDDYFSMLNERRPVFVMTDLSVPMNEIFYICTNKNNISVRTAQTVYNSRKTLKEFEDDLNPDLFMRIGRGTIICFAHIKSHKDCHLLMEDDSLFDVSRRLKNEFLRRYTRYLNSHH